MFCVFVAERLCIRFAADADGRGGPSEFVASSKSFKSEAKEVALCLRLASRLQGSLSLFIATVISFLLLVVRPPLLVVAMASNQIAMASNLVASCY